LENGSRSKEKKISHGVPSWQSFAWQGIGEKVEVEARQAQ